MITISGHANSGTTWYALHKAIEYCKARYNPNDKEHPHEKPTMWVYGEINRKDILKRIEKLYPNEMIVGELGCLELKYYKAPIPYQLDSIIAESMQWKFGDIVVVDCPIIKTSLRDNGNVPYVSESATIKFALTVIQKHTGVVMYFREPMNRSLTSEIEFKATYSHNEFEWNIKTDGETQYVKLIKMK